MTRGFPSHPNDPRPCTPVEAHPGLVVEDVQTGYVGAIVRSQKAGGRHVVYLEDRHGKVRGFPMGPGFWIDGKPVSLVPMAAKAARPPERTASGSVPVVGARARVARGSRIWVEGRHDAELVERVWGEDLRIEGVVVELLNGVDHLEERAARFGPDASHRVGVLVDHLVPESKETRIVKKVQSRHPRETLLILGHPFVDVWQAIKPTRLGLAQWPVVERGTEWKIGVLRALGLPHEDQADVAKGWEAMLRRVRDWRDLEPAFSGRVEELIDFVTLAP